MKKLIAILLTFAVSSITLGSQFINGKKNHFTEVYAAGSVDCGDPERNLLLHDLCQTFDADITDCRLGSEILKGSIDPEAGSPEFEVTYDNEYTTGYILLYPHGERDQAEVIEYQLVDNTPLEFTGEMSISYYGETEQVNFFDIMTDEEYFPIEETGEDEDDYNTIVETGEVSNIKNSKGEECEPHIFGFILSAIAAKVVALAVAATVVIVAASLPRYFVSGLTPAGVGSEIVDGLSVVFNSLKYELTKFKQKLRDIAKDNKDKRENHMYYITIPVVEENVDMYRDRFSDIKVGDMLVSVFPVIECVAKATLRKGYSIYSYYTSDAKTAMKNAWVTGRVVKEKCDELNSGYYHHFHAYPANSKNKRSGIVDGVRINIHGFYGEPA